MGSLSKRVRSAPLVAVIVVFLCASAGAAPLNVRSDRSDNTFYFSYDATSGEITESSSGARFVRSDPVTFILYVREAPDGAEEGDRLRARFALELNKQRVVRYRGVFTLEARNSLGEVVYTESVKRKVVLRPTTGERKKSFSIGFDLPSGSYESRALFKSS